MPPQKSWIYGNHEKCQPPLLKNKLLPLMAQPLQSRMPCLSCRPCTDETTAVQILSVYMMHQCKSGALVQSALLNHTWARSVCTGAAHLHQGLHWSDYLTT